MMRRALAGSLAVLSLVLLAWASHRPVTAYGTDDAVLRVSWSARPERIETCRRLTEAELAERAEHMRRQVECEGTTARYVLVVRHDDRTMDSLTVRGGGLRHDRELYVLRDRYLPSGRAAISVRFIRLDSSAISPAEDERGERSRESDERNRRRAEAIPPVLALDTVVTLEPRRVMLVTYDAPGRRLVLRDGPETSPPRR